MIDIAEVAQRSGQPASALRYYEDRGLIQSIGRKGLRRTFSPSIFERLSLIALGRAAGFSLDEIRDLMGTGAEIDIDRTKLLAKANELDQMINRLTLVRDGLRSTADCPCNRHLDCPNFQGALSAAGEGRLKPLEESKAKGKQSKG